VEDGKHPLALMAQQIHGHESPMFVRDFITTLSQFHVWNTSELAADAPMDEGVL